MRGIEWHGWRSAAFSFCWMFLFFLGAKAVLRLHSLGQPVIDLVVLSIGVAALFTLFRWIASGAAGRSI